MLANLVINVMNEQFLASNVTHKEKEVIYFISVTM